MNGRETALLLSLGFGGITVGIGYLLERRKEENFLNYLAEELGVEKQDIVPTSARDIVLLRPSDGQSSFVIPSTEFPEGPFLEYVSELRYGEEPSEAYRRLLVNPEIRGYLTV